MCFRLLTSPSGPIPVSPVVAAGIPGFKKVSSLSLDPKDGVTLRARVIRFHYLMRKESTNADNVFVMLCRLVECISNLCASRKKVHRTGVFTTKSRAIDPLRAFFSRIIGRV